MVETASGIGTALRLKRTFSAPRARVFDAWTDPGALLRWFRPGGYVLADVDVDLQVGGHYRLELEGPDGGRSSIVGTYRQIDPPERLVFTWSSEMTDEAETLVTVELTDHDGVTELVLVHERLVNKEAHQQGWLYCLDELGAYIEMA